MAAELLALRFMQALVIVVNFVPLHLGRFEATPRGYPHEPPLGSDTDCGSLLYEFWLCGTNIRLLTTADTLFGNCLDLLWVEFAPICIDEELKTSRLREPI